MYNGLTEAVSDKKEEEKEIKHAKIQGPICVDYLWKNTNYRNPKLALRSFPQKSFAILKGAEKKEQKIFRSLQHEEFA